MDENMREKILQKLLDFFSELPDQEGGEEKEGLEIEGEIKPQSKIEVMSVEAEPKEEMLSKLKGM